MTTAYMITGNGKIQKDGKHLVFHQADGNQTKLQLHNIDSIMVIGNISISVHAMKLLSQLELPVAFVSDRGELFASFEYQTSKNVFLQDKQFRIYHSKENRLRIAKAIVKGKIYNQLVFAQRINRKQHLTDSGQIDRVIANLKKMIVLTDRAKSTDQLRGYEGTASKSYFSVLGLNIYPEWAIFEKRNRNPPKTNVNAVLSFLYTLLSQKIYNLVRLEGLNPMVGVLHELCYGRDALIYDLMEEFRVPICDAVCCNLFNRNILRQDNFRNINADDEAEQDDQDMEFGNDNAQGVYLNDDGVAKTIAHFEEKLNSEIIYSLNKDKMKIIDIIDSQVKMYKRVINDEEKNYQSFMMK